MELGRDHRRTSEARTRGWFVRAQGITLGPYSDRDVLEALETEEILPSDHVFSAKDGRWTALEEHPYFASFGALVDRPRAEDLAELESPRKLRVRPVYSVPVPATPAETAAEPALAAPPAVEEIPEPAAEEPELLAVPEPALELVPESVPELAPEVDSAPDPVAVLEALPSRPEHFPETQPEPVLALAPSAEPAPEVIPEPEIPADTDELLAAALALEQALDEAPADLPVPEVEPAPPEAPAAELRYPELDSFPSRPEIKPVFLADPIQPEPKKSGARVIRIELKVPDSPLKAAIAVLLLAAIAFATATWAPRFENKTRGQNDFRPSDPSSPTTSPLEAGDPIPPLKAPTRPQRE